MQSDKRIGVLFNRKPDVRTFAHDSRLPIPDKYVGIEIEAENIPLSNEYLSTILNYWEVVTDGSLRNYGTEFVSSMLRGSDISAALVELNQALADNNMVPDFTDRTSVHIHIDGRFSTAPHLRLLVLYYLMYEPLLFSYVGKDRENNPFCVPFYKNTNGINNLAILFKDDFVFERVIPVVRGSTKYEAMNLRSLQEKGSIEFRAHYGTLNIEEIFNWIKILLTLFRLAKETSEESFFSSLYNTSYEERTIEIRNLFLRTPGIDLNRCDTLANESIAKLLLYSKNTRSAWDEMSKHWGRGVVTSSIAPPTGGVLIQEETQSQIISNEEEDF